MTRPSPALGSLLFASLVAGQAATAWDAAGDPQGFYAAGPTGHPFPCRELMSSGGDEQTVMILFTLALPSALLRLLKWHERPAWAELPVYLLLLAPGLVLTLLPGCADAWGTLVQARHPWALGFAACSLLAPVALIALRERPGPT